MAKLKLDKESLQGFFFNHTEKIVLAVVLLLLGLFIWSGSSLEGIGAQSPALLVTKVDAATSNLKTDSWESIKVEHPLVLDHVPRQQEGDAPVADSYYRLETPLSPPSTSPNTPRLDPTIFPATDLEATVVVGALAFKATDARKDWVDPFADLENMEQKKIEAPKKRPKKKKKSAGLGMYGESMEGMMPGAEDSESESMYASGMAGMYGQMEAGGGTAVPAVRADASKLDGYRPAVTSTATGSSVLARSFPTVSVKALVPYQQQWDEFERVFADAAGYQPARDVPRYLSFRAERAEVPSDPDAPLTWTLITTTDHALSMIPKLDFVGYPGELADSKYLLPGILTMPVPPLMMRDLRSLALHSKVPIQEEKKVVTPERTSAAVADINELGNAPDPDALPAPETRTPGGPGSAMYGGVPGTSTGGMEMYGGGEGGYGGGMGGYGSGMGGMSTQVSKGPQAEFLMVRFFDHFVKPGVKYVYRIQVTVEDPNHPQNPQLQPTDRNLADTTRERLAKVIADEAKQTAALKTPVRIYMVASEWSEPSAPISVSLPSETYAGGVTLPRMLDILRSSEPNVGQKSGYAVPDGEPLANLMDLTWSPKYAADIPAIVMAARGAYLNKPVQTDVIDPITLIYKRIPDYPLASGDLLVDLRGGDILEAPVGTAAPLLTPGEIAVIDASGNFIVRNELDDWQVFEKYAPPPPIVVDAPTSSESSEAMSAEFDSLYSSP